MSYADKAGLYNRRILVVEDEAFIALMVRDVLIDVGCRPIMALNIVDALVLANREQIDCAFLDVSIGDETVFAVADALLRRNVPLVFTSGHQPDVLPERYRRHVLLLKPYSTTDITRAILAALKNHSTCPEPGRAMAGVPAQRDEWTELSPANSN